uniref:ADP-ribosyl cyclase/cyclic ADP-ribose hydrolase n=1 Tax=Fagus sylvatica TaxID=28930 RepID=A0A2N9FUY5_FAGSY
MATQTTSSSSSSWKYDVFLSFCGVDTRKNFTDHLYTALKEKGIVTFRDDEKLERGKNISLELLKAIEESKYAIIVLSSNYASSRQGLLLKPLLDMKKIPRLTYKDVQEWKAALKEVGNISGWHLHDRHESIIIQEILGRIFNELNRKFSSASKDLVGIASRVEEMLGLCLSEGLGGVRFVGICGMGGIGKTTLAQEIYERISGNFEASSFIDNVREETKNQGLVSLQKQLLCKILVEKEINIWDLRGGIDLIRNRLRNKKVLIVLDDVDGEKQLEALAGKHDWFGVGSRIIVTSRDSHLLRRHGVDDVFTTKGLNNDEALELFSWRAFKKPHPEENYVDLSKDFVNYTNGLPLALKVLDYNLDVLVEKYLISINEMGTLWMHDLLQEMGKEIVCRESPKELGGRSRLWLYEDALHVLKNSRGTEAVEGIMVNTPNEKEEHLSAEAFSKMKKLRLLKIDYLRFMLLLGNLKRLIRLDLNGCKCLESLPHKINLESLEVFTLSGCSRLKKFPEIVGNMSCLSELYLNETAIKTLPVEHLTSLITLDLRHCNNLSSLPNAICSLTSLKTLALSGCSKLDELPKNLGHIKGLKELDVSGTAITRLPSSVVLLKNLKVLSLHGCEGLSSESSNNLLSFPLMRRRRPDPMSMLEHSLSGLWSLTELNLSYCNLRAIPDEHSNRHSVHYLDIPGSEIPKWFSHQKVGASMNLQVPSDLFYKCMGIAVCIVHECKEALSQSDANGFIQIEIKFEPPEGPGLEVTKCGAHLVYEEDLNQTMGGCSITPYEDDVDDLAKDNIIKRSCDDYDG